jgi:aspartyl-tRNA synthetase
MTEAERISNIYRRVSTSGNVNRSTSEYLKYLKNKLSVLEQNKTIEAHNQSVLSYNSAIESINASVELFNAYIDAKNKQFGSDWPDQRIKSQLEQIDSLSQVSIRLLNQVVTEDAVLLSSLSTLKSQVLDMIRLISAEQEFFLKYSVCPAEDRKKLFYK